MRIHRLSFILTVPFAMILVIMGYFIFKQPDSNLLAFALIPLTPLMLIYLFSPQIDYWWLTKHPVELEDKIKNLLSNINPIYDKLSPEETVEFDNRLSLFVAAREYSGKGMESDNIDVPHDIKMMISQIPVTLTMYKNKNSFKDWERVILYKHPFPSPRYKFLHTMETFAEDGVIILSLEHVERALMQKGEHYDVGWHAYAEAYMRANPREQFPDLPDNIWESIEKISPQDQRTILATLGFKEVDVMAILINLYFNYSDTFRSELPDIARSFDAIFR